jgi:hypothetical protein
VLLLLFGGGWESWCEGGRESGEHPEEVSPATTVLLGTITDEAAMAEVHASV